MKTVSCCTQTTTCLVKLKKVIVQKINRWQYITARKNMIAIISRAMTTTTFTNTAAIATTPVIATAKDNNNNNNVSGIYILKSVLQFDDTIYFSNNNNSNNNNSVLSVVFTFRSPWYRCKSLRPWQPCVTMVWGRERFWNMNRFQALEILYQMKNLEL